MNPLRLDWKRTFFTIFAGQAFSLIGSSVVQFSIVWWLTQTTGSAVVLTMASMAGFLPQALIGPFAGAMVDRLNRKQIMILSDLFVAATSLGLAIIFLMGEPPLWVIYLVLGLRSIGTAFHMPSMQASIPLIAPEDQLMRVQGWTQLLSSATIVIGPMLGAFMLAMFSMEHVLLIDIVGAVLASISLLLVRIPQPERKADEVAKPNMWREMKYGLQELGKSKALVMITVAIGLTTFVYVPVGALFNLMVLSHFGGGAWHAGVVEFSFGIGMMLGSILLGSWGAKQNRVHLMAGGIGVLGLGLVFSGLLPTFGYIAFVGIACLMGVSGPIFGGPFGVMIQTMIDPAALGRVMALINSMMLIATPVGLFVAGPLAEVLGVAMWFVISGSLIVLVAIWMYFVPSVRELRRTEGLK
ncbi:MFS transporter [Brevibacillus nitrificans]|uniref:MFS transporter n=1 Tax=Brevibacillus nitrificans TaxID=651560 RepID=A0A3M8CW21_9BACL|nr:MFS transporter [Brevibacillus nitrificans]RNB80000.1 MFS transporter [Brevibacillus nitrificans]